MDSEQWAEIRRLHLVKNLSKTEIARRLGIYRGTVAEALKKEHFPRERVKKRRSSLLDRYKNLIKELLEKYPSLSAVRIYEEIKNVGYSGKTTILRDYLARLRGRRSKEAFLRIETLPGEQAQVDWGYFGTIKVGDYFRRLYCFVMVLSFSRMIYLEFTLSCRLEDFLRCHVNAFGFFGGVPKKIVYDNLKSVCLLRYGNEIKFNPRFLDFAGYYLFKPVLCNPAKAHEKGKVESAIKYVRYNFFSGRQFRNISELNQQAIYWRDNLANVRIHGTTRQKPIERFLKEEKVKLGVLPEKPYDTSIIIPVNSSKDCRVRFDSNFYSLPFRFALHTLTLKATPCEVFIYYKDRVIAKHNRSYLKYQVIENPKHIRGLLESKVTGRTFKMRDEFLNLCPEAEKYFQGLVQAKINLNHHLKKILNLIDTYDKTEVCGAIAKALSFGAFGADYIENIIQQRLNRTNPINTKVNITKNPHLIKIRLQERNLKEYDQLTNQQKGETNED